MMRMSSTYHLYKIALLVKTDDAVKDSMILRAGEPSKALYFVVSGTVEVIQVFRRRRSARRIQCRFRCKVHLHCPVDSEFRVMTAQMLVRVKE